MLDLATVIFSSGGSEAHIFQQKYLSIVHLLSQKKSFQFLLELILCARVSQPPIVSLFLTTWVLPQLPKCLDLTLQTVSALLLSVWREGLAQALAAVHFKVINTGTVDSAPFK